MSDPISAQTDDLAEALINPRPSAKRFANLDDRLREHERLVLAGTAASAAGEWDSALEAFSEAYPLMLKSSTLLSALGIRLQRGEAELAAACYAKLLESAGVLPPAERDLAQRKLVQASALAREARAILKAAAPPAAAGGSAKQQHDALVAQAEAAAAGAKYAEAYALLLEAWPLLHRPSTLISAAAMLLRDGRESLAAALLVAFEQSSAALTDEEADAAALGLGEARRALGERQRLALATRTVQASVRGRNARMELEKRTAAEASEAVAPAPKRSAPEVPALRSERTASQGYPSAAAPLPGDARVAAGTRPYNDRLARARLAKGGEALPAAGLVTAREEEVRLAKGPVRSAAAGYDSDDDQMLSTDYHSPRNSPSKSRVSAMGGNGSPLEESFVAGYDSEEVEPSLAQTPAQSRPSSAQLGPSTAQPNPFVTQPRPSLTPTPSSLELASGLLSPEEVLARTGCASTELLPEMPASRDDSPYAVVPPQPPPVQPPQPPPVLPSQRNLKQGQDGQSYGQGNGQGSGRSAFEVFAAMESTASVVAAKEAKSASARAVAAKEASAAAVRAAAATEAAVALAEVAEAKREAEEEEEARLAAAAALTEAAEAERAEKEEEARLKAELLAEMLDDSDSDNDLWADTSVARVAR